ncbi:MAG: hypothetical protein JW991_02195 [Candidatus Pacebacteria bacterium]|nr:hypothetical protein [Candidatus Paceibacterota bacterium]
MKKKSRFFPSVLIIPVMFLAGFAFFRYRQPRFSPAPSRPTTAAQLAEVIKASGWIYDVKNPDRERNHVTAAPAEITEKYLPLWKKLFMEKNDLNPDYFDRHIKVLETGISTDRSRQLSSERGREYFEVLYHLKIDWIELNESDHLVIRKEGEERYLSPEEFISEEKNAQEKFRQVKTFTPLDRAPISFEQAVLKLQQSSADAKYLKPKILSLGLANPAAGEEQASSGILLFGEGIIDSRKNQCVTGYLNLNTGRAVTRRIFCQIE